MSRPDPADIAAALERDAARRATALARLRLLGAGPHPSTDRLVRLVTRTLDATFAALVLVDGRLARVQASTHRLAPAFPAETSLSAEVLVGGDDLIVTSVSDGKRRHPAGLLLRSEAAVVIRAPDGVPVGAVEVGWREAVEPSAAHRAALHDLGGLAEGLLELRADVEEYRRFVELSPDAVVILDLASAVRQVNPALLTLLGCRDRTELVGRSFIDLVVRADRVRVAAQLTRVPFSRATTGRLDTQLVRPDGGLVPCSLSIGLLGGTRRHLQVVVHDLSGRLRDEEARTALSEQLARAQRLDAVGQVAGGLAHDLNNLLMVMATNLSLAFETLADVRSEAARLAAGMAPQPDTAGTPPVEGPLLASLQEDLDEVRLAVDRASALTRQLLQFARREQGRHDTSDVAAVVDAVCQLTRRSLGRGVDLEVDLGADLPPIAADPVQLERALLNLVNNARDAVGELGTIRIEAHPDTLGTPGAERRADLAPLAGRPAVRLAVTDDGVGMDEVTRARACEPLFTTKPEGAGTGLGLSAVLAFADEVDALLHLRSAPAEGTTATLVLPVEVAEPAVPVGTDQPVGGKRVALVDPGERTRRVIARMLGGAGYRVTTFSSGEEALASLAELGTDLLVTELVLPAMTGTRLITDARRLLPGLPVVVLASVEAPRALDGDPVLVKPFSQLRLLRTVERVLTQGTDP